MGPGLLPSNSGPRAVANSVPTWGNDGDRFAIGWWVVVLVAPGPAPGLVGPAFAAGAVALAPAAGGLALVGPCQEQETGSPFWGGPLQGPVLATPGKTLGGSQKFLRRRLDTWRQDAILKVWSERQELTTEQVR